MDSRQDEVDHAGVGCTDMHDGRTLRWLRDAALRATYGETLQGPLAQIVVRSWGAVIAIIGVMLIYGAFNRPSRPLDLIVAGLSKLIFIGLVLIYGTQYLG